MISLVKIRLGGGVLALAALCVAPFLSSCETSKATTPAATATAPPPKITRPTKPTPPPADDSEKKSRELTDQEKKALKNADLWVPK